ncbi:MAG: alanine/glycine:cation symporter family protein [Eubacteriales bacterium]|nr:alanine/glycine:cation symporter family protein [Eubacteriales bacterium]
MGRIITEFLNQIDSVMYYPILLVILAAGGLFFTIRTKGVQIRLLPEACKLIMEEPDDDGHQVEGKKKVSSFQALMVSTASRVGTGNIVGVSTAICLGGAGSVFWMWIMCIIGAASAFAESTLAQIYKQKDKDGTCYGGPAYYIEKALHAPWASVLFSFFLIATYGFGFNVLCSFNLQSSFSGYSFYGAKAEVFGTELPLVPIVTGLIIAILVGYCLFGGGKRIVRLTSVIVPVMGVFYVAITLIVIVAHISSVPAMFAEIFRDAFDFKAIFGGIAGSCMIYGFKRGLYSNEAGVGSAPNASASAHVSHPAKQGLVQTVSVYIDTMLLCTATAFMCLSSGVVRNEAVSGAPFVQNATETVFGTAGPIIITVAMVLFAFTTLLGNLFYVDNALAYLNGKKMPTKTFMNCFHLICVVVIFLGAIMPMDACWALADITMGGMALINVPSCVLLSGTAVAALKDYEKQRKAGKNPRFRGKDIGIDEAELSYWK